MKGRRRVGESPGSKQMVLVTAILGEQSAVRLEGIMGVGARTILRALYFLIL